MRRSNILLFLTASLMLAAACSGYDDNELRNKIDNLDGRVTTLEKLCDKLNSDVASLQSIVNALQNNDYVTSVVSITENGQTRYVINFSKFGAVTVYNGVDGANGKDGADGTSPVIGVKQDTDGIWYWTLNGQWMTDNGKKSPLPLLTEKTGSTGRMALTEKTGAMARMALTEKMASLHS